MRTEGVQWLFKALTLDAQNCVRRLARGRRRVLRFREHRSAWFDLHGGYWKLAACPGGRWDGGGGQCGDLAIDVRVPRR